MDDNLEYYSFLPVLGSDGSVVAVPYLGLQNGEEGSGVLNDSAVSPVEDSHTDFSVDEPSVQVVQDLSSLDSERALSASSPSFSLSEAPVISDTPPDRLLFHGCVWVHGTDSLLGETTLYFPIDSKPYWGLDSDGYLVYLGHNTMSGYHPDVYNHSIALTSFSRPRYRAVGSSNYTYMEFVPDSSNAPIAVSELPRVTFTEAMPLFVACALGVVILFLSRLRR